MCIRDSTVTEIYDYLRLLYARVGVPHCPVCGRVISQQTVDEKVDAVLKLDVYKRQAGHRARPAGGGKTAGGA